MVVVMTGGVSSERNDLLEEQFGVEKIVEGKSFGRGLGGSVIGEVYYRFEWFVLLRIMKLVDTIQGRISRSEDDVEWPLMCW